jgi:transposase
MATVFWGRKGVLMGEFMHHGTRHKCIAKHCKGNCAGQTIQNKRRGMLTYGEGLLHDNGSPRTAARTRALLEYFNWELFDHPPYRPDLAPSDCHLFTYLKNWLGSQRFKNNELMESTKDVAELTGDRFL